MVLSLVRAMSGFPKELFEMLHVLSQYEISPKDKWIGSTLLEKLATGIIRQSDYEERGWATR